MANIVMFIILAVFIIVMFIILAVFIIVSALMCVATTRIVRAATFMLFVLLGVAGIYFLLDYTFLGAAQIAVYAGGVTMVFVFAIQGCCSDRRICRRRYDGLCIRYPAGKQAHTSGFGETRKAWHYGRWCSVCSGWSGCSKSYPA